MKIKHKLVICYKGEIFTYILNYVEVKIKKINNKTYSDRNYCEIRQTKTRM